MENNDFDLAVDMAKSLLLAHDPKVREALGEDYANPTSDLRLHMLQETLDTLTALYRSNVGVAKTDIGWSITFEDGPLALGDTFPEAVAALLAKEGE